MQILRGPLAALTCLSLLIPSEMVFGQAAPAKDASPPSAPPHASALPVYHSSQIQGDDRIIHALNRFTFGVRPGDLETVRTMGLDRWLDQQLHPAQINQAALNARLAQYPAMQWSSEDLLYRLPSNAVIRQALDGKAPVPDRGVLHAIYEDQMYRVADKKQEKQAQQAAVANASAAKPVSQPAAKPESKMAASDDAATKLLDSLDKDTPNDAQAKMSMAPPAPAAATPTIDPAPIVALPPQQRVARLVAMQPIDLDAFIKALKGPQRAALYADLNPDQKQTVAALENPQRTVAEELIAQRLTCDIYSNAQLQEVMTDFWFNHFNVYLQKNEATPYYLASYERDVIRPHALGKFEDLLEATAHSPAMLLYLDNAESIGPDSLAAVRANMAAARQPANQRKAPQGLNENYARELMELHTLGVNGGYTQADVTQVARILTGWGVDRPQRGGGFTFNPNRHEPGPKKVMGRIFKENGEREGRDLLHFLATRPATAHFVSHKLAVRFVSDDPPQSLVDRMAKSYLASGGDISVVLKTMFHAPEFWSTTTYRAKVKTPLEYVVSAARASNADITNFQPLTNALRDMGMPVFGCIPPTGYKWDAADWVSTGALVNRMNFALSLAANRLPGITMTWSGQNPQPASPESEEARLQSILVAGEVSESTRASVLEQLVAQSPNTPAPQPQPRAQAKPVSASAGGRPQNQPPAPSAQEKQDQLLAGLLLGSPEFQRR